MIDATSMRGRGGLRPELDFLLVNEVPNDVFSV